MTLHSLFRPRKASSVLTVLSALTLAISLCASSALAAWQPVEKIAFVGDSITRHGPAPERLGWTGDWGMAATARDRDYVHRLVALIGGRQKAAGAPQFEVFAEGGGRLAGLLASAGKLSALHADVIVVQMGENDNTVTEADFFIPYKKVVEILRAANPRARILCLGVWNPGSGSPAKDDFIKKVCAEEHVAFVNLSAVVFDPANQAGHVVAGLNKGVGWHPSDAGMDGYARAILAALDAGAAAIPSANSMPRAAAGSGASRVILNETFSSDTALAGVIPSGVGRIESGALRLSRTDPHAAASLLRVSLPLALVPGHTLKVSGRVKAAGLTTPPNWYNGVKLMLDIVNAEGVHDYPQAHVEPASDFGWREVSFTRLIPENVVSINLVAGLELVTGTTWFDDLKVEVMP